MPIPRSGVRLIVVSVIVIVLAAIGLFLGLHTESLPAPKPSEAAAIELRLRQQTGWVSLPTPEVLSWVLRLPDPQQDFGELWIGLRPPASLPRSDLMPVPIEVLSGSGWYLSVSDSNEQFAYIAWLGDPGIIRGEGLTGGTLDAAFVSVEGGVLSGKAPFVTDGVLRVFKVENDNVQQVFLHLTFPDEPYSARGKRFKVQAP